MIKTIPRITHLQYAVLREFRHWSRPSVAHCNLEIQITSPAFYQLIGRLCDGGLLRKSLHPYTRYKCSDEAVEQMNAAREFYRE